MSTTSTQPPTPPASATSVLVVVDDDANVARALGMWMQVRNKAYCTFESGEALLGALDTSHGVVRVPFQGQWMPVETALLDLNLPGISGYDLARKLLALDPQLRVVIMTATMVEERYIHGTLPEGVTCLTKPFTIQALDDALLGTD